MEKKIIAGGFLLVLLMPVVMSGATYENCMVAVRGEVDWVSGQDGKLMLVSFKDGRLLNIWIAGTTPYNVDWVYLYLGGFRGFMFRGHCKVFMVGFVNEVVIE